MTTLPLADLDILILEDEYLIAMDMEELCRSHGARSVDIVSALDERGLATVEGNAFDGAILDLRLGPDTTLEVARSLKERNVPFVFATGYARHEFDLGDLSEVRVVSKPYVGSDLIEALAEAIRARRS